MSCLYNVNSARHSDACPHNLELLPVPLLDSASCTRACHRSYEGGGDRQSYGGGRHDYHGRAEGGHRGGGRYGGTSGYGHAGGRGGGGRFDGRGGGRFGGRGGRGDIVFDPNAVPAEFSIGLGRPDPADDYAPAAPEPRRAEDAPSEVALVPMRRPGYGVAGTRVKLLANHFLVKCAGGTAVQHCVTITEILVEGNPNPFPGETFLSA